MKYIYGILGIILLLTCVMWVVSSTDSVPQPGQNALVINERSISFAELQKIWQQKPYHYRDQREFLDDLVMRELLIQQAISAGIAEEQEFKRLIQDFFEQSLIKTLLDRKQQELKTESSAEELNRFRQAQSRRYHLTTFRYQNMQQAEAKLNGKPEKLIDDFVALPGMMQLHLLMLEMGQLSAPFSDGDEYVRLQVDKIETSSTSLPLDADEELQAQLRYLRQQQHLEEWLLQLRKQALVRYPQQQLSQGEE